MGLEDAMAEYGPAWLGIWLNILMVGGFFLPLTLVIWKPTRLTALYCVLAGIVSALGVGWLYEQLGYVKLLGLPHIIFWTPLAIHLWRKTKSTDVTTSPRIILWLVLATILISLAFDYSDVIRYLLGERTALAMPASDA